MTNARVVGLVAGVLSAACLSVGPVRAMAGASPGVEWLLLSLWPVFAGFLVFAYFARRMQPRSSQFRQLPSDVPAGLLPSRPQLAVELDDLDDPSAFAMLHHNVYLNDLAQDAHHRK